MVLFLYKECRLGKALYGQRGNDLRLSPREMKWGYDMCATLVGEGRVMTG